MSNNILHEPKLVQQVMVSSTFTDLQNHRQKLIEIIRRNRFKDNVMENDSARPDIDVIESSLEMVRDSSAYIAVISMKYGQTPEDKERNPNGYSLTELEFREALSLNRPILLFIMGDDHLVTKRDIENDSDKIIKLNAFRENAKVNKTETKVHRIYSVFNNIDEFAENAAVAVSELRSFLDKQEVLKSSKSDSNPSIENSIKIEIIGSKTNPDTEAEKTFLSLNRVKSDCDIPPNTPHWVGRQKELSDIDLDLHKVVFISGIGGQGKSGLASHYIKEIALRKRDWEFWDWRDCQEKENRIHTKIISIISRLTSNRIKASQIADENVNDLIELFFEELSDRKIIFVFDNIDAYIEFENFQLVGTVEKLYKAALNKNHKSKFLFTCRSSINDIDTELLTIKLQGLSKEETISLFLDYNLSLKKDEVIILAEKSFYLTKGHPLWLNLIAAQARRGLEIAEKFITGISINSNFQEDSLSSILSNKILRTIWDSLNDKQKTLLMALGEIVRAENYDNLSKILDSELNHNQFSKAFKALKQLNLVVIKSMIDEQDTFELHPLVREYVIQNFSRTERSKYISLFVKFYDDIILVLKPKLNSNQPLSFFENWTAKIELAINNDDYKTALVDLEEVCIPICDAGYVEEYLRVSNLMFINIDWKIAINEEYSYFNSQFSRFMDTLTEFGKYNEADAFLKKYEKLITNKGLNYVIFCKAKGHFLWFQSRFDETIKLIEECISFKEKSLTEYDININNTLALALRDTKIEENINKALEIFLNGKDLSELIEKDDEAFIASEVYGNVGRCLQYNGNVKSAIICFQKSLKKLEDPMNRGYGLLWYAECMINENKLENALFFYKNAYNTWIKVSPIKAMSVDKKIKAIIEVNPVLSTIIEMTDKEIERICHDKFY